MQFIVFIKNLTYLKRRQLFKYFKDILDLFSKRSHDRFPKPFMTARNTKQNKKCFKYIFRCPIQTGHAYQVYEQTFSLYLSMKSRLIKYNKIQVQMLPATSSSIHSRLIPFDLFECLVVRKY